MKIFKYSLVLLALVYSSTGFCDNEIFISSSESIALDVLILQINNEKNNTFGIGLCERDILSAEGEVLEHLERYCEPVVFLPNTSENRGLMEEYYKIYFLENIKEKEEKSENLFNEHVESSFFARLINNLNLGYIYNPLAKKMISMRNPNLAILSNEDLNELESLYSVKIPRPPVSGFFLRYKALMSAVNRLITLNEDNFQSAIKTFPDLERIINN